MKLPIFKPLRGEYFAKTTQIIFVGLASHLLLINTAQAAELPKYQVEVIVFETTALRGWTEEAYPFLETEINLDGSVPATSLPKASLMLKDEASKLTLNAGYKVLVHQAYTIYGMPENKATKISFQNYPESEWTSKVKGTLLFYKSRFPHVDLTVQLDKAIPTKVRAEFAAQQKITIDTESGAPTWRFVLSESRKTLRDETHYIDHPIYGALVKVQLIP